MVTEPPAAVPFSGRSRATLLVAAAVVIGCSPQDANAPPPPPVNLPPEWTSLPALTYDVEKAEIVLTAGGRDPEGKKVVLTCAGDVGAADSALATVSVRAALSGVLRVASEKRYRSTCTLNDGQVTTAAAEATTLVPTGPTRLVLLSDTAVEGFVATAPLKPFAVRALDSLSRPVAGVVVRFAADAGVVAAPEARTDTAGNATTSWTLPDTPRVATLTATLRDYPGLTVRVSARAYPRGIDILGSDAGEGEAKAVSDAGYVVGFISGVGGAQVGFLWKQGQALRRLDLSGAWLVYPMSVNNHGVVVGWYQKDAKDRQNAFVYDSSGWRALPGIGGTGEGAVYVDDSGRILGFASNSAGYRQPVLWLPDGTLRFLAVNSVDYELNGVQILPDGRVLAYESRGTGWDRPVLWENGSTQPLWWISDGPAQAWRMNRAGVAAGIAAAGPVVPGQGLAYHATIWTAAGPTSLASNGELQSWATGIDGKGRVYGYRWFAGTDPTAVYWSGGAAFELLPVGMRGSSTVRGASETGFAVGAVTDARGRRPTVWKLP